MDIQGCGAPEKNWRFEGAERPGDRGENGDLRVRAMEERTEI